MSNAGFTLLWSKILDSSVWMESMPTRIVWIAMLAMKDGEGRVIASPKALAHRARVEPKECEEALRVFMSPDAESGIKTDEGRKIQEIPGGWLIINHEEYRFSTAAKREFWREQKRQQREKQEAELAKLNGAKGKRRKRSKAQVRAANDGREKRYCEALDRGDEAGAEGVAGEDLPG